MEFIFFLRSKLKTLIRIQLSVTILSILFVFFYLKPWYRSSTTLLVTDQNSNNLISALASSLPIGIGGLGNTDVSKFIAILTTDRVADSVIRKFDLQNVYKTNYYDLAVKEYRSNLGVLDNDDNTILVTFQYENDAKEAAEITQYLYDILYDISVEIERKKASNFSNHIQKYLQEKRNYLKGSEDSLRDLQIANIFTEPVANAEILYTKLLELEKEKLKNEFGLFTLEQSLGPDSREAKTQRERIEYFNQQILNIESESQTDLTLKKLPNLSLTYFRLIRNIEVTSKVVEFLQLQYEQALLDEEKTTVNIQQISKPRISDTKVKPKRLGLLIVINGFSLFALIIFFRILLLYNDNKEIVTKLLHAN